MFEKLASLFLMKQSEAVALLEQLTEIGFVAGGSVVWSLCEIDDEPSDIDLFVNSGKDVLKVMEILFPYTKSTDHYIYGSNSCSIVDVNLICGPQIQIVCVNTSFKQTIDLFDMDYVQCGIHKGELYLSEPCKRAHETKTVSVFTELPTQKRLEKALKKGFRVPYFTLDLPDRDGRSQFKTVYQVDKPMVNKFNDAKVLPSHNVEYFAIENRDKSRTYKHPKLIGVSWYEDIKVFALDVGCGKPVYASHISMMVGGKVCICNVEGVVEENVEYLPID
jgi:hypothetical protein